MSQQSVFSVAGTVSLLLLSESAAAQGPTPSAQGTSRSTLEEVVVTARKRVESAQNAPLAITAFNADMLEKQQVNRIDDLSHVVPSLMISPAPAQPGTAIINLRGFGTNDQTNLLGDAPVAIYIDGVYSGRSIGTLFSLVDLERVEVAAGPQGTLFGRNVTGGAVSLFTKSPAEEFGVQQKFSYGSYADFVSRTTVDTGELGNTGLYAKLAYMHHEKDGYIRNTLAPSRSQDPGAVRADSVFFALRGDLTPAFTTDYKFDWDTEKAQPITAQIIGGTTAFANYFGASAAHGGSAFPVLGTPGPSVPPVVTATGITPALATVLVQPNRLGTISSTYAKPGKIETGGHNLTLNYALSDDVQLKSITAYRSLAITHSSNFGGSTGNLIGRINFPPAPAVYGPVTIFQTRNNKNRQHQVSEELQLNGKVGPINYVAGLYYFDEHVANDSFDNTGNFAILGGLTSVALTTLNIQYTGRSTSKAAFSDVAYTPPILNDKLEVSGGVRYTEDTKELHQTLQLVRNVKQNFYNVAVSGSAKYQWSSDVMTYVRVAQAYKAGGFNPRDTSVAAFNPEKALSYEIGLKADLFDGTVRLNGDIYHTDYKDMQLTQLGASGGGFSAFIANAGHATFDGLEAQLTVLPADGWQVDASVGYIDPKFKSYISDATTTPPKDIADIAHFSYMAERTYGAGLQYTFEPLPFGELTLRGNWSYRSKRFFQSDPTNTAYSQFGAAPAIQDVGAQITLVNIPVNLFGGSLEAQLYGKNLLDKHDVLQTNDLISSLGFTNQAWGIGREYGISVTGKF
jgi:iron complex outermembrane receptor protein